MSHEKRQGGLPHLISRRDSQLARDSAAEPPRTDGPVGTAQLVYRDPLDIIWLTTAQRLGMEVVRSADVYASWDGQGTLRLADAANFDPDDSLAQMILHEICHALVEGPEAFGKEDWGLDNVSESDLVREHACHRVQAALADRHGLRRFFEVTTDFRPYYVALPRDPLERDVTEPTDPAVAPARVGFARAVDGPWAAAIASALGATADIARSLRAFTAEESLWHGAA